MQFFHPPVHPAATMNCQSTCGSFNSEEMPQCTGLDLPSRSLSALNGSQRADSSTHSDEQQQFPIKSMAKQLRQMDGTIRCVVSLGRPSGCGMPGSVGAAPLAQLLHAAISHMQQCCLQQQHHHHHHHQQQGQDTPAMPWSFVDIGAGAGRMLLAASMFGASCCAGLELCDLTHTFEACKARLLKKGLLQPTSARSCSFHVGDAMQCYTTSTALLGPAAPAGPVMASMIDEGMPMCVREHIYCRVAQDMRVHVLVTVNYKSRAGHLPAVLTKAGFKLVQEMPAPLMGGRCSTAGRIYVRRQQSSCRSQEHQEQTQQEPVEQQSQVEQHLLQHAQPPPPQQQQLQPREQQEQQQQSW